MNGERLEKLVEKIRSADNSEMREAALELVQAVMDLHASGLERVMDVVTSSETATPLLQALVDDPEIGALLLLHGLHPEDVEARVHRALARPALRQPGAHAEVMIANEKTVRVRIDGGPAFEDAVRRALVDVAPDAQEILVESSNRHRQAGFVPLAQLVTG